MTRLHEAVIDAATIPIMIAGNVGSNLRHARTRDNHDIATSLSKAGAT